MPPSCSVVIVTWNSAGEIDDCLRSIARRSETVEVLVVDNASSDDTRDRVLAWTNSLGTGRLRLISLPDNRGYGAAANVGVREAQAESVAVLNADLIALDETVPALCQLALDRRAICGPRLLNSDMSIQPSASAAPVSAGAALRVIIPGRFMTARLVERCEPWRSSRPVSVGWLTGACIAGPRDLLLELGPFDSEIHLYGEDLDLGLRADAAGIESIFDPTVGRLIHLADRSSAQRFPDAGLALSVENRRRVVAANLGSRAAWLDTAIELAALCTRIVAKTAMRKDATPELRIARLMLQR